MQNVYKTGTCPSNSVCESCKVVAQNLKHLISYNLSEFLKDIIINQFFNISLFSKDSIGNTLIGYDMFHVFEAIVTNNVK